MTLNICNIISKKRYGGKHTPAEINALVQGFVTSEVADYQMSAWLMAVCINGLDEEETVALTQAMVASGETIDLSSLPGKTVDKHSTGGVGDKTTLVLAPLLASAGLTTAKMSGRGLGITGGTIDKLESIPRFSTSLTKQQFLDQARRIGCVVAGQTADLVPADKKMYALRDVTGTVECIPLIASSIMSKKIACGAITILLDVKFGSGAFMKDLESARELAKTMIDIGNGVGRKTIAAITRMDQPLGYAVGNTIEVVEAIDTLRGVGPSDLRELCIELGALLLVATGSEDSIHVAKSKLIHLLDSGEAFDKFKMMVEAQGGDTQVIDNPSLFPQAKSIKPIHAASSGYIHAVDAGIIGQVAGMLGAGRRKKEDSIDPTAGVLLKKKIGDVVQAGEEIAVLLSSGPVEFGPTIQLAQSAFAISSDLPSTQPIIAEILGF